MAYLFFSFLFALAVATFAVQNSLPVTVNFFLWNLNTTLVIVILGSATFGALIILSLAVFMQFRLRLSLQRAKQQQGELEEKIKMLKNRLEQETAKTTS